MSNAKGNSGFRGSGLMDLGVGLFLASPQLNISLIIMSGMAPFILLMCIPQQSNMWQEGVTCKRAFLRVTWFANKHRNTYA